MTSHLYRCQLCTATYVCPASDTDQLLQHANAFHPNVIGQFTIEDEIPKERKGKRPLCAKWALVLPNGMTHDSSGSRSRRKNKPCTCVSTQTQSAAKSSSETIVEGGSSGTGSGSGSYLGGSVGAEPPTFWTTVETWRPGPSRIPCPNCGVVARPLVRRQKRLVNSSLTGALCTLSCWPVCFLPFMSSRGPLSRLQLYCSSCDHFIAVFDTESETFMRPPTPPSDDKKLNGDTKKTIEQNRDHEGRGDEPPPPIS